jgi:RND family efflux transporter MFP subunit
MRSWWGLVVFLTLFLVSCGREPEIAEPEVIRPVKTMVLGEGSEGSARAYPGVVKANQNVDLAFQVPGPLVELPVKEGDRVEAGTVVARIRKEDFETKLANAKGSLERASSELVAMRTGARPEERRQLEARLEAAQADFEEAKAQYVRYKKLYEEGVTPKTKFDEYVAAYGVAQARLKSAHEELTMGLVGARVEDIESKKAEIRGLASAVRQAEIDLGDTDLQAPFSGVVAKRYVENFQNVQAKEPIVSLQDVGDVEVVINLPENDVILIKKENVGKIIARFDAIREREFELTVKEFSTQADPTTQTYAATLVMKAPEDVNILPGMTAQVSITLLSGGGGGTGGLSIPSAAVFSEGEGKTFAWKVDPSSMTVTKVPVELGALSGENIQVKSGLSQGDKIGASGVHHLREGMKIREME